MASLRLSFATPPEGGERLIAELWEAGTSGVEILEGEGEDRVEAYFESSRAPSTERAEALAKASGARFIEEFEMPDQDWLADYRARSQPIAVGPFTIDPGEPEDYAVAADEVLRIPARNAFGTGSHESTRLMLETLAAAEVAGHTVLDVGTGSGILAFAALRLGARRVAAFDLDVGSVVSARDNARLNDFHPLLFGGTIDCVRGGFHLVLVNILPHRWLDTAPSVVACLVPGGALLVSGLLAEESGDVESRLAALGLVVKGRRRDGEWAALLLEGPL